MSEGNSATRRTVLKAAGVTLGTAALGSAAYATRGTLQEGSGASVDWYNSYQQGEDPFVSGQLFDADNGTVAVGNDITKLTSDGEVEWQESFPEHGPPLVRTTDDSYFTAWVDQPEERGSVRYAYAKKTGSRGSVQWTWTDDSETETAFNAAAPGPAGGGYGAGYKFENSDKIPYVVRFAADGTVQWKETYDPENTFQNNPSGAVAAPDGGVLLWHLYTLVLIAPDGSVEWTQKRDNDSSSWALQTLKRQSDGGYVGMGTKISKDNVALLFFDENGHLTQTREITIPNNDDSGENVYGLLQLARTDAGYVIMAERKYSGDTDEDYPRYDAWVMGVADDGSARWFVEPGDDSNYQGSRDLLGNAESVIATGSLNTDDDREAEGTYVTRITEGSGSEQTPTETETEPETEDDDSDTPTPTPPPARETEEGTQTQTDEEDCEI